MIQLLLIKVSPCCSLLVMACRRISKTWLVVVFPKLSHDMDTEIYLLGVGKICALGNYYVLLCFKPVIDVSSFLLFSSKAFLFPPRCYFYVYV